MADLGAEFANRFIGARQGFHEYVLQARVTDPQIDPEQTITDINVSGINNPTEFDSINDVKREYEYLAENLPDDEPDRPLISQKIDADRMMLGVLTGEEVAYGEFVLKTMGFLPKEAPDETIEDHKSRVDALLQQKGLSYDANGLSKFEEQRLLTDPTTIRREFDKALVMAEASAAPYLFVPSQEPLVPEFVNEANLPWSAYFDTNPEGKFQIKVNTNPDHPITRGKIRLIVRHEIRGHVLHMLGCKRAITSGDMSKACGLTSMTSPETTHAEAVAAYSEVDIPKVIEDDENSYDDNLYVAYNSLYVAVMHNAIIRINNGVPQKDVIDEAAGHLPREDKNAIKATVVYGRDKPTYRAVLSCYQTARELVAPVIAMESADRRQKAMTPNYVRSLTLAESESAIAAA